MSAPVQTNLEYEATGAFEESTAAPQGEKGTSLAHVQSVTPDDEHNDGFGRSPTEEEVRTLGLVAGSMPWPAIAMCLIEFAERASYYGSTGPFSNFIQRPVPDGSPHGTGAVPKSNPNGSAGALGLGLQTATALTTLFQFLAYVVPIFGGIMADTKWGRFKTICVGTAVGALAHVLLVIPAIPSVIASGHAIAPFIISILILAFAAGFIKPSLGPLLCDQSPVTRQSIVTLKNGDLAILDPNTTVARYLLIFYWAINIGAFFQLATTYAEKDVGFWLAYLLPGIIYMLMPIVLVICAKHLVKMPPQGSVVVEAWRVFKVLFTGGGWKHAWKGGVSWWNRAKPSVIAAEGRTFKKEGYITWDDTFVDELKQALQACKIFLFIPIFNMGDSGLGAAQNSQAAQMISNGVPNDLIGNFNSLTIVVFAPIINFWLYPWLAKRKINFTPMARMSVGFLLCSIAMIIAAILQWKVYSTSPCGYQATTCETVSTVSLWAQIPLYSLPAIGEIFVNVTSYQIAYTRAPARMKGLVYAMVLFTTALSSALVEIINPSLVDPYLIWPFAAIAIACFICALVMPLMFRNIDAEMAAYNTPVDRMKGKPTTDTHDVASEELSEKDHKHI